MQRTPRKLMVVGFAIVMAGCASKKAIVTMPLSGAGSVGDELASTTLTPCRPTASDPATCTLQINSCPHGIGKLKIVRKGNDLIVTPSCFIPVPVENSALEPLAVHHEDPGDL